MAPGLRSLLIWLGCAVLWLPLAGRAQTAQPPLLWACVEKAEPYCHADAQGRPAGLVVKLVEEIARGLKLPLQTRLLPWARAQALVREGQLDLMVTIPTQERFAYAYFGRESLVTEPLKLIVRAGQPSFAARLRGLRSIDELRDLRLVTYLGDGFAAQHLSQGFQLQQMTRADNIPLMLLNGRAEASIGNVTLFRRWLIDQKIPPHSFEALDLRLPDTQPPRVLMLSRRSPWHERGLLRAMDAELRQMKRDGRWQALVREALAPYGLTGLATAGPPEPTEISLQPYYRDYELYPAAGATASRP